MLGIYDSGLGGITVLREILASEPHLKAVYLGDTLNCPLGEKSTTEINLIVRNGLEFLFSKGCNLVILACNTATAVTIRDIQNEWLPDKYPQKKVLGIIKPTTELLIENQLSQTDLIGIFATKATINSNFYKSELQNLGYKNIIQIAFSGLAEAIEVGNWQRCQNIIKENLNKNYLEIKSLKSAVLACTHYPIVKRFFVQELENLNLSHKVLIIDQAISTTEKLFLYTKKNPDFKLETGQLQIYSTKNPDSFEVTLKTIFKIENVVDLAKIN